MRCAGSWNLPRNWRAVFKWIKTTSQSQVRQVSCVPVHTFLIKKVRSWPLLDESSVLCLLSSFGLPGTERTNWIVFVGEESIRICLLRVLHLCFWCIAMERTMAEQPARAASPLCLKLVLPVLSFWPWRDDVCDGSCNVIALCLLSLLWSGCQRETVCTAPNIVFAPRNSVGCNLVVTLLDVTSLAPCKHQALIVDCALCARCVAVLDVIWTSAQICCHCVPQCLRVSCKLFAVSLGAIITTRCVRPTSLSPLTVIVLVSVTGMD